MVAGALAFAAVSAIVANALFLQAGRHPAPMFGHRLPARCRRLRPAAAARARGSRTPKPADVSPAEPKPAEAKARRARPLRRNAQFRTADGMTNLIKATAGAAVPAPISSAAAGVDPSSSRAEAIAGSGSHRMAAVQRALTEYGYGQLKPTGIVGADTQAAIQKFEREHKLPVTGQMSDRLVHELRRQLAARSNRPPRTR